MQAHWRDWGPPVYITAAMEAGHRPPSGGSDQSDDLITDPEQLAAALSQFPGGNIV